MSGARKSQSLPSLPGLHPVAAAELRNIAQTLQRIESRTNALEAAGFLTKHEAEKKYSPSVISRELASDGSAPLNVVTVGPRTILQSQPMSRGRR